MKVRGVCSCWQSWVSGSVRAIEKNTILPVEPRKIYVEVLVAVGRGISFFCVCTDEIFASACCRLTKISAAELGKYGIERLCKGERNFLKDTSVGSQR